jgi:hypothetical protein
MCAGVEREPHSGGRSTRSPNLAVTPSTTPQWICCRVKRTLLLLLLDRLGTWGWGLLLVGVLVLVGRSVVRHCPIKVEWRGRVRLWADRGVAELQVVRAKELKLSDCQGVSGPKRCAGGAKPDPTLTQARQGTTTSIVDLPHLHTYQLDWSLGIGRSR